MFGIKITVPAQHIVRRTFLLIVAISPVLAFATTPAAAEPTYLDELIQKSRDQQLHASPTWHALLHYKKDWIGNMESQVDGADFFLSPHGKFDAQKELEASLIAFFSDDIVAGGKLTAQCRFVARFKWLNEKLQFDASRMTIETCDDFNVFLRLLNPATLTVIFPTTHPGSPSSMFGHTLLRIDKQGQSVDTRMLGYSINYAAQVPIETGGVTYAALGLSGGFPGRFNVLPYYTKLREYAQMESRDIWEYTLNLDAQQIDFVLRHAYELAPSYFDYYFFTENCSYHVLSLLDVVFPELPLSDEFSGWVIPVDTLKLLENRGLITRAHFQPSSSRTIKTRRRQIDRNDDALALRAYREGFAPLAVEFDGLSPERKVAVLDLLSDFERHRKIKNADVVTPSLNAKEKEILLARSRLRMKSPTFDILPPGSRPDFGHGTSRVGLSLARESEINVATMQWRPAYHDLLDPSDGYNNNSGLSFMDVRFNYGDSFRTPRLQSLSVLDILSLEPRDEFFRAFSWRVNTGWRRLPFVIGSTGGVFLDGGAGVAYALDGSEHHLLYSMLEGQLEYNEVFDKNLRVAPGISVGGIFQPSAFWRINVAATARRGVLGEERLGYRAAVDQSYSLSQNWQLRLELSRSQDLGKAYSSMSAGSYWYY